MKFLMFLLLITITAPSVALDVAQGAREPKTIQSAEVLDTKIIDYLSPIRENDVRTENMRNALAIEPLTSSVSVNDFKSILKRRWRMMYHCDGAPVLVEQIAKFKGFDGWTGRRAELEYEQDHLTMYVYRGTAEFNAPTQAMVQEPVNIKRVSYDIKSEGSNIFTVSYKGRFRSATYKIVKVVETGETVVEVLFKDAKNPELLECKPGVQIKVILAPVPGLFG